MLAAPEGVRLPPETGSLVVTGANGHLGQRLLRRLSGQRSLRAIVRSQRAADQIRAMALSPPPTVSILDYADTPTLTQALQGCTHAVHLVGILKENATSRYEDAHERSTRALADAAGAAGLERVVYLSIVGSQPDADNACLASKGRAEEILLSAATPALILRVPMVLGEGDYASRALFRRARARAAWLTRGGTRREQPVYAEDVVEAIVAGIASADLDNVCIDLAGPESLPHRQLVARAATAAGLPGPRVVPLPYAVSCGVAWAFERFLANPPITRPMLGVLDHEDTVDTRTARERLGIELTPLDEMLRRCMDPESER
ncbi:MAG: NAD(P)H-binding protein [Myxococcota bacterium]|nr:NAD(P)H-binding protein [Myxococcota bacterium]